MHAVVISGGRVAWAERPEPGFGSDELLVEVRAAGLNGADLLQVAGRYPPPPGSRAAADVPGLELAGVVVAAGSSVRRFSVGDRVMGLAEGAAQAELAVLHERVALPVPAELDLEAAGGFPEVFATAYDALFTQAQLGAGDRLLVNGAAGGVGTAAVQLGVATGASVVASVRAEHLRERVASLGAEAVGPDGAFSRGPYDVVLELVGAVNLPGDLDALATGGRVVVIGVGAGARSELDLRVLMARRGRILASTLRSRSLEEKAILARTLEHHVFPLLAAGRVRVLVEATYAFGEVERAYEHFARGKLGKIVLVRR
ncbi:MAG TPA: zinc-binding dehydrogenase [Acidimicrobiales bacterium]|nr:zinc-binding dehydrogenase [Acidimicrobiales bacterium]